MNNVDVLQPPIQSINDQVGSDSVSPPPFSPLTGSPTPIDIGADTAKKLGARSKLRKILEMQEVVYRDVMGTECDAQGKASLIRAWDLLEDRIRILRGHLKAGSVNESRKGPDASKPEKQVKGQVLDVKAVVKAMKSGENSDAQ